MIVVKKNAKDSQFTKKGARVQDTCVTKETYDWKNVPMLQYRGYKTSNIQYHLIQKNQQYKRWQKLSMLKEDK